MTISQARLEANRRNAQKSTGPRTDEGKKNSSQNAVTHGCRAETLVLRDEDPAALEQRRAAWRACLAPGDDVEERLVETAVVHTWMQDRARRAQAARLNANLALFGADQSTPRRSRSRTSVRGSSRIATGRSRFIRTLP